MIYEMSTEVEEMREKVKRLRAEVSHLKSRVAEADAIAVSLLKIRDTARSVVYHWRPAPDEADPLWRLQCRLDEYDASAIARSRPERDALREAAQWILHTISGVSRDGGPVTDDECLASYDALRAAIEGEGGSDERE